MGEEQRGDARTREERRGEEKRGVVGSRARQGRRISFTSAVPGMGIASALAPKGDSDFISLLTELAA